MTPEEHQKRHAFLHAALDELLADYIAQFGRRQRPPLQELTVVQLLEWNRTQKGEFPPDFTAEDAFPLEVLLQRCIDDLKPLSESEINARVATGHKVVILDSEDYSWVKTALLSFLEVVTRDNGEENPPTAPTW